MREIIEYGKKIFSSLYPPLGCFPGIITVLSPVDQDAMPHNDKKPPPPSHPQTDCSFVPVVFFHSLRLVHFFCISDTHHTPHNYYHQCHHHHTHHQAVACVFNFPETNQNRSSTWAGSLFSSAACFCSNSYHFSLAPKASRARSSTNHTRNDDNEDNALW